MDKEIRQRAQQSPVLRIARWTVPWVILGIIAFGVLQIAGRFREAKLAESAGATGTVDATASVTPTATGGTGAPKPNAGTATAPNAAPGATTVAQALVEGVLLRKEPSANGEVMDRLKNGTQMTVLEQTDTWLKVRDPEGRVGWIRNNENLISLKTK